MMSDILEVENLSVVSHKKGTRSQRIIQGINLNIEKGKITGIVGESGSGKSMTMKAIMNLLEGKLESRFDRFTFEGQIINKREIIKRRLPIAMIFQDPMTSLNPLRTIGYHLMEVIRRYHKVSNMEAKKLAIEELNKVGIDQAQNRMGQYPHELSGGMRQRIMVAMAMLCKPKILIADEPTTALDVTIQAQILSLIRKRQREEGLTVLLVTHDFGVVAQMCDNVIVMLDGKIVEQGTSEAIFYQPAHTYTQELLKAIPGNRVGNRLYSMQEFRLNERQKAEGKMILVAENHWKLEE
ncbi:ABC transporter ATP-binding protein [Facklamia sp. DSM 111018]|uniref:ABC transporter ATP-binding protein n=1 Tax=Facklamia lactis TaxID=2749967 RepID=A0ABS0LQJ0_9LACT|nr:ABC transporter ATP-binding protein [Facklamia lactis]MBG9986274.1 ABC transporter ATP-binding protein [Facklamia lactis]